MCSSDLMLGSCALQLGNFDNEEINLDPFSPFLGSMTPTSLLTEEASVYPLTKCFGQVMINTYSDEGYSSCHIH